MLECISIYTHAQSQLSETLLLYSNNFPQNQYSEIHLIVILEIFTNIARKISTFLQLSEICWVIEVTW